jgi:hypothetical protein
MAGIATIKIVMHDFESVVSKDKKDEYVTMWYKQVYKDKNGKIDSVDAVNDFKFVNGKIVALDEALRHFPAPQRIRLADSRPAFNYASNHLHGY